MQGMTKATKLKDITRVWQIIDVKDKTLGRIAVAIAHQLMGKAKPYFTRNLDCGDYIVVVNAMHVKVTGKKEEKKKYYRHSGYPGGFKSETLSELRFRKPEDIIYHAVKGMLPQNRLRNSMMRRLWVFPSEAHKFQDKFKKTASDKVA